jgi:hypothetical protein
MKQYSKYKYTGFKILLDESKEHFERKYYLSLVNIFAGIYNKDKSTFDKGQRQFQKYNLERLESITETSRTETVSGSLINEDTGKLEHYTNENWIIKLSNAMKGDHDEFNVELNHHLDEIEYWN